MVRPSLFLAALGLPWAAAAGVPPGGPILAEAELPAYERDLDHAGLIGGWNRAARERGERVYQRVCHACHGDLNLPGSLPDAVRFAEARFQHGSDPLTLYRTLTRGWRLMPPQTALTPREKYDVIHYVREAFLAGRNPTQYFPVNAAYLAALPTGRSRGPEPSRSEPWRDMDRGRFLIGTYEIADAGRRAAAGARRGAQVDEVGPGVNLAQKGIAIRLDPGPGGVAAGRAWVVFEHDTLRVAAAWSGEGFIDWEGIAFNGRHMVWPRTAGTPWFETADAPGWADPATDSFVDRRITGVDGRRFGPLPREWLRFRGLHRHGDRVVLDYAVGTIPVREAHALETAAGGAPVLVRVLNVGPSARDLRLRVANAGPAVGLEGPGELAEEDGFTVLRIPAAATPARLAVRVAPAGVAVPRPATPPEDLEPLTRGGPARWPETVETAVTASPAAGAFGWERLGLPFDNPWRARIRPGGFDFAPGGDEAALCTWDGDVWRVSGLRDGGGALRWRRIAAGLFQPLGLKFRGGDLLVACRDQIVALRDRNGDGEADFLECFNSDHQVTEHFHEFAMGLQADEAGNLYYAKSARHARTALVPHHGTLLRVSADGGATTILARGFRAANGVCLSPDGSILVTDQEGHWMPMNRVNRIRPGGFYGNLWGHGAPADESDGAMAAPVCWIDKAFDRSPGEVVAVTGAAWGRFAGTHLNLSYGVGRLELLFSEPAGAEFQGAVCALPVPDFPTGIMRGRFHPGTGDLYMAGLSAWATSQTLQEGGFYRLRPTGRPAALPVAWRVGPGSLELTFSEPPAAVEAARFAVRAWDLRRSASYGSPRLNERSWPVTAAAAGGADPRVVRLEIPGLEPAHVVEITCRLRDASGAEVERVVAGTIHRVPGGGPGT